MICLTKDRRAAEPSKLGTLKKALLVSCAALALAGCRDPYEMGHNVTAWSITDHSQRHPILVSKEPARLTLAVPRRGYGLTPSQRARLLSFLSRYRAQDAGNSSIHIAAPSGSANEVSAMHAVHEVRELIEDLGFDGTTVRVDAYQDHKRANPPIRVSYFQYVAEGPECGDWSKNLAKNPKGLAYPDFGCADQNNLAAMVANPADLLGPRTMTPRSGERRDVTWGKYKTGDSTASQRTQDERVQVEGN